VGNRNTSEYWRLPRCDVLWNNKHLQTFPRIVSPGHWYPLKSLKQFSKRQNTTSQKISSSAAPLGEPRQYFHYNNYIFNISTKCTYTIKYKTIHIKYNTIRIKYYTIHYIYNSIYYIYNNIQYYTIQYIYMYYYRPSATCSGDYWSIFKEKFRLRGVHEYVSSAWSQLEAALSILTLIFLG
jgi:hypothetical protein